MSREVRRQRGKAGNSGEACGFTLIEVMVAIVILFVGILGLTAMMVSAMAYINTSEDAYIAQQKAEEAVESVFFARDSKLFTWAQIENAANGGIFLDGPQPLLHPGANGIVGTDEDEANVPDVIIEPGPDGVLGTADDIKISLSDFTRQIAISDVAGEPNLRQIQVTVRYLAHGIQRQYVLTSYISAFS
jgi:prepilin-type N-terminal cleavage/methylation domain-containing protein